MAFDDGSVRVFGRSSGIAKQGSKRVAHGRLKQINVNQRRTLRPPDFVHKLLKHMEKGRIFRDLFGVQS